MNNGDNTRHATIVLAIIIVTIAIIIGLNRVVNNFRDKIREKREKVEITENVTTTNVVDYNYEEDNNSPIIVTNFAASLKEIDPSGLFNGAQNRTIKYSGAIFKYHCSEVVEETCNSGSVTMNVGTTTSVLYFYENQNENFALRAQDYHIIVDDKYIILTSMKENSFIGEAKVYTRNGEYLKTISNVTMKYNYNDGLITTAYPKLDNDNLKYEMCKNTQVYDSVKNLTNDSEPNVALVSEANCN